MHDLYVPFIIVALILGSAVALAMMTRGGLQERCNRDGSCNYSLKCDGSHCYLPIPPEK
jgi:hypothetical protein